MRFVVVCARQNDRFVAKITIGIRKTGAGNRLKAAGFGSRVHHRKGWHATRLYAFTQAGGAVAHPCVFSPDRLVLPWFRRFSDVDLFLQLDQDLIAPEREHDALARAGQVHDYARLVLHPQLRFTRRGKSSLPRSLRIGTFKVG